MNSTKKLSIALSLFFFGLFIFSAQASSIDNTVSIEVDQNLDEDEVIVFASALFYGKKARLRFGETSASALKAHGIPVIRSIKIPSKTKVVIHYNEKADETLYSSKDRIDTRGLSSVTVARFGDRVNTNQDTRTVSSDEDEKIELFQLSRFGGKKVTAKPGTYYPSTLKKYGIYTIRSAQIPNGMKIIAHFEDGTKKSFYNTDDKLAIDDFRKIEIVQFSESESSNNNTASNDAPPMKDPVNTNSSNSKVELFQLSRFGGKKVSAKEGTYYPSSFKKYGIYTIRSAEIPKGMKIVAYFEDGTKNTFYNTKDKLSISDFRKIEIVQFSTSSSNNSSTANNNTQSNSAPNTSNNATGESIKLFQLSRFGGKRASLRPGTYYTKTIKRYGIYTIRSAEIPKGMKIVAHFENGTKKSFYNTDDKLAIDDFRKIEIVQFGN